MKNLINFLNSIKIKQFLTVFVAGCLLLISTACSNGNLAQAGGKAYTDTAKRAMSDTYDDYDAKQSFKGGMNGYNDDPRYSAETAAKTKALVDQAKSRQTNDLGEHVSDITDTFQENLKNAPDKAQKVFKDATNTAQNALDDASSAAQRTTKEIKGNIQDLT